MTTVPRIALQRLLWPGETQTFADGSSVLAGVVADLREVVEFTEPAQIVDAHGFADLAPTDRTRTTSSCGSGRSR